MAEVDKVLKCLALELPESVYNEAIPIIKAEFNRLREENEALLVDNNRLRERYTLLCKAARIVADMLKEA